MMVMLLLMMMHRTYSCGRRCGGRNRTICGQHLLVMLMLLLLTCCGRVHCVRCINETTCRAIACSSSIVEHLRKRLIGIGIRGIRIIFPRRYDSSDDVNVLILIT